MPIYSLHTNTGKKKHRHTHFYTKKEGVLAVKTTQVKLLTKLTIQYVNVNKQLFFRMILTETCYFGNGMLFFVLTYMHFCGYYLWY